MVTGPNSTPFYGCGFNSQRHLRLRDMLSGLTKPFTVVKDSSCDFTVIHSCGLVLCICGNLWLAKHSFYSCGINPQCIFYVCGICRLSLWSLLRLWSIIHSYVCMHVLHINVLKWPDWLGLISQAGRHLIAISRLIGPYTTSQRGPTSWLENFEMNM